MGEALVLALFGAQLHEFALNQIGEDLRTKTNCHREVIQSGAHIRGNPVAQQSLTVLRIMVTSSFFKRAIIIDAIDMMKSPVMVTYFDWYRDRSEMDMEKITRA